MRLMRFTYGIIHVPGKDLVVADTLSRAPLKVLTDTQCQYEAEAYVDCILESLPASEKRLQEIRVAQEDDDVCRDVMEFCHEGWPEKHKLSGILKPYWEVRGQLAVQRGLLMKGSRIVIPSAMRRDMLDKIHQGHQGVSKCRERAKQSIWWPGLSTQLQELVSRCTICAKTRTNRAEPMMPSKLPERPWQKLGMDLFELKGKPYLLVVDYFSRYVEIVKLTSTTSSAIIDHLKSLFARHGIPETVRADNGPQFKAASFARFADEYGFTRTTSSPHYQQSNGEAERLVQTVKNLLVKAEDPYLALLAYRATPLSNGCSPAELLMGRKLRTTLPTVPSELEPKWPDFDLLRKKDNELKAAQKANYDSHHGARHLTTLQEGDHVWLPDMQTEGTVTSPAATPRSYHVQTPRGTLRRNRRHLVPTMVNDANPPGSPEPDQDASGLGNEPPSPQARPQRARRPPTYLADFEVNT